MKQLLYRIRKAVNPRALVLMYHRITELESDVWDIAVSPANFEAQLQILQKGGKVISLRKMAEDLSGGKLKRGSIAITFDDGYSDNYTHAMPLLEKYQLPATFFIASGNLGREKEFWWDELEYLMLFSKDLPQHFIATIGATSVAFDLGPEVRLSSVLHQTHQSWQGCEQDPPTQRAQAYMQLWQAMRPLPHQQQQEVLAMLREWAGMPAQVRQTHTSMSVAQLKQLASRELFEIGIHTENHPALAYHSHEYQQKEIRDNKLTLEEITGKTMALMAYPFGNFNEDTQAIAAKENLLAAVTTREQILKKEDHLYRIPRFQVKNWPGAQFQQQLKQWYKIYRAQ